MSIPNTKTKKRLSFWRLLQFVTQSGGSPYHTIPPADVIADGWVLPPRISNIPRPTRSTSLDNLRAEEPTLYQAVPHLNSATALYEYYKRAYAETLHRWGLLYNRAEVIKYMCKPPEPHKGVEFLIDCRDCLKPSKNCICGSCKKLSLNCIVCHVSVRGSANCCVICGHGGHTNCLKEWFSSKIICLTGCGCHCLAETAGLFNS